MRTVAMAIALALAVSTLNAFARDAGGPPPPKDGPKGGAEHRQGGFHVVPPRAVEALNLTADQQKQLADLEAEVKAKLEKILTPEQMQKLSQMRPPRPPAAKGEGGPDGGGPGGGEDQPARQRPPAE